MSGLIFCSRLCSVLISPANCVVKKIERADERKLRQPARLVWQSGCTDFAKPNHLSSPGSGLVKSAAKACRALGCACCRCPIHSRTISAGGLALSLAVGGTASRRGWLFSFSFLINFAFVIRLSLILVEERQAWRAGRLARSLLSCASRT